MRRLVVAFIIGIAAGVSVSAQTDLLQVDPWARHDAAIAAQDRQGTPQFSLAAETLGTPSEVSPLVAPVEDLFKKNYWFLVVLDTKEVFTAPARWDTRDWMVLGGIAAGIGTVAAFDKDIEHAIRGARSNTMTSIFDNVQPLGNEYAIGIVGSFYIYGEIFKDPRAKTTALDSIAATAIASGIVTNSFKYVIGRGRPTDWSRWYRTWSPRPFNVPVSTSSCGPRARITSPAPFPDPSLVESTTSPSITRLPSPAPANWKL